MKRFLLLFAMAAPLFCTAQLKSSLVCNMYVDVLAGTVNGVEPDYLPAQVKKNLPCFTSEEAETASSPCGGVIHYRDNDIYFYTGKDYIEIKENFKGKLSIPLMGAARENTFASLGNPKLRDVNWDAFQTQYGTLILYYGASGRVNKIQFSSKPSEILTICN
jgi:hypothetical protein